MSTLRDRLRALKEPTNPEDVAKLMRAAGVKGRRLKAEACPIALYLAGADDVREATVVGHVLTTWLHGAEERRYDYATLAVMDFVDRFDGGQYPDLTENA